MAVPDEEGPQLSWKEKSIAGVPKAAGSQGHHAQQIIMRSEELEHPTPCGKKGEALQQMFLLDSDPACSPASKCASPARWLQLPEEVQEGDADDADTTLPGNDTTFLYCDSVGQEDAMAAPPHNEGFVERLSEEQDSPDQMCGTPSQSSRADLLKVSSPSDSMQVEASPQRNVSCDAGTWPSPTKPCTSLSILKEGSPSPVPCQVSFPLQEVPHYNNGLVDDYMTRHPWAGGEPRKRSEARDPDKGRLGRCRCRLLRLLGLDCLRK
mmetsp:Transcript_5160/g.8999  ORF Transcript_5160/g.8999 Transcript_5160/m.8999 type:complete len:266 (-) Transcript_5160:70-867(-)